MMNEFEIHRTFRELKDVHNKTIHELQKLEKRITQLERFIKLGLLTNELENIRKNFVATPESICHLTTVLHDIGRGRE